VTPRILLKGLLLIASLALLGWLVNRWQLGDALSEQWIDTRVRGQGFRGELIFLGMAALTTAVGFPRQVVAFLGGYAFGFVFGALLAVAGTLMGTLLAFFYARWFGRSLVQHRFPGRIRKLDDFLSGHPFTMAVIIRLLPVGSNVGTNLVAGVCRVAALPFLAGSGVGYLPQTLVFALAGSGVNFDPSLRLTLAAVLFVVSSLLGSWLYRSHRHGAALEEELDGELDRELGDAHASAKEADARES
jgi:uncharacterized membrane protein YdjX (TVP38/TMEM64 family)